MMVDHRTRSPTTRKAPGDVAASFQGQITKSTISIPQPREERKTYGQDERLP